MKQILFNTETVRAIIDGRKTVTRRAIKLPEGMTGRLPEYGSRDHIFYPCGVKRPPYKPGDILYVRETFCVGKIECGELPDGREALYVSQGTGDNDCIPKEYTIRHGIGTDDVVWNPSIHMPKNSARIFLRVANVRVERLQDIDDEDAKAEGSNYKDGKHVGFEEKMRRTAIERFTEIWDSTIPKKDLDRYGWDADPWVWVIEFQRISREEFMEADCL